MNKQGHFYCEGCGCDRPYADAVNEIIDGCALCYRCNKSLEIELGKGSREEPHDKVTLIKTDYMNHAIAEGILTEMDLDQALSEEEE